MYFFNQSLREEMRVDKNTTSEASILYYENYNKPYSVYRADLNWRYTYAMFFKFSALFFSCAMVSVF